MIFPTAKYHLK